MGILTWADCGSDSTVIVTAVPAGPSPKNSGLVEVTTSPSLRLVKVTVFADGVAVSSGIVKPEEGVASEGSPIEAFGIPSSEEGGRLLKS